MSVVGTQAPIKTLFQYLSNQERVLEIPPWQRDYVWKASPSGEVGQLLLDLKEFIESDDEDYLLGTVFLSENHKSLIESQIEQKLLIDGQQRTLTLTLIFMACAKYIKQQQLLNPQIVGHTEIVADLNKCLSADVHNFFPRVSMTQGKANEILNDFFHWTHVSDKKISEEILEEKEFWTQTQRNLVDVLIWVYDRLVDESWLTKENFLPSLRRILDKVKLIEVTISNQKEAIQVFDRINSRGASLNSGDLIKNMIFEKVEDENVFDEISSRWTEMSENLGQCSHKRMRDPKFLLRAMALRDGSLKGKGDEEDESPELKKKFSKITYAQLTDYWSERTDPQSDQFHANNILSPKQLSKDLVEASKELMRISFDLTPRKAKKEIPHLYLPRYLGSVQHFPILLAGAQIEDPDVYRLLTRQVTNRTAFYLLSEEKNQDFEALVPNWSAKVFDLGKNATADQLTEIYAESAKISAEAYENFKVSFMGWSYKDPSAKKKIRAVLSHLSWLCDATIKKPDAQGPYSYFSTKLLQGESKVWDIDHISPGGRKPKESSVHRIGNLVLLHPRDNSFKKDALPIDKADVYKGSHLVLTQTLAGVGIENDAKTLLKHFKAIGIQQPSVDLENWNEDAQNVRAEFYWELLIQYLTSVE